jgi:SAM-dependent methyltransferase
VHEDLKAQWYKRWAKELKQDKEHLEGYALYANKFWQNAVMVQALFERSLIAKGSRALGFGVGQERLPALFAKYGVEVTATDQDFRTVKAGHWAEHELATSAQSLNKLKICGAAQFRDAVEYMPVDMTKVPDELHGSYNFLWSNCALGHLGSIPAGLNFIEESLKCLKPGGWAVHTTELNILSDTETVTSGSTVVFRLKDIYNLHRRLAKKGYIVQPLLLDLGDTEDDRRISVRPEFGNDFSKIQIMGHLSTQIVLLIQKPEHPIGRLQQLKQLAIARNAYRANKAVMAEYKRTDKAVGNILRAQRSPLSALHIVPQRERLNVSVPKGSTKTVWLAYSNTSDLPVFGIYNRLADNKPVVLATSDPRDRTSGFYAKSWLGSNRVSSEMFVGSGRNKKLADYVEPHSIFSIPLELSASSVKPGVYEEVFSLVQEEKGWLPEATVNIRITVTK